MKNYWQDKYVVVTGAASGIGLALLQQLSGQGAFVLAVDLPGKDIPDLAGVSPLGADLKSEEGVDKVFAALQSWPRLDLFLANAGFAYYEALGDAQWSHLARLYQTNLISVLYSMQKCRSLARDKNCGAPCHFAVTASAMAYLPLPGYALYSSSKAALKAFFEAFAWENGLGPGPALTYSVAFPIATKTRFFGGSNSEVPLPRPTQTADTVARKILHGVRCKKKKIFPSAIFRLLLIMDRILPFSLYFYALWQKRHFKKYLQNNQSSSAAN
jgi:short-subunit dehydrogenase